MKSLAILLLLVSLTACEGGGGDSSSSNNANPNTPSTDNFVLDGELQE